MKTNAVKICIAVLIIVIVIVMLIASNGDDVIYCDGTIEVAWSKVTTDIQGNAEDSIHYHIVGKRISPDTLILIDQCLSDTSMTIDISSWRHGMYIFGIQAIDAAQHKSVFLWSNDTENSQGSWVMGIDREDPQPTEYIKINN